MLAVLGGAALFSSAAPSARQIAANLSACSIALACSDTDDSLKLGSKSDGGKHSKNKDLSTDDISDADRSSFFVDDGDSKAAAKKRLTRARRPLRARTRTTR